MNDEEPLLTPKERDTWIETWKQVNAMREGADHSRRVLYFYPEGEQGTRYPVAYCLPDYRVRIQMPLGYKKNGKPCLFEDLTKRKLITYSDVKFHFGYVGETDRERREAAIFGLKQLEQALPGFKLSLPWVKELAAK